MQRLARANCTFILCRTPFCSGASQPRALVWRAVRSYKRSNIPPRPGASVAWAVCVPSLASTTQCPRFRTLANTAKKGPTPLDKVENVHAIRNQSTTSPTILSHDFGFVGRVSVTGEYWWLIRVFAHGSHGTPSVAGKPSSCGFANPSWSVAISPRAREQADLLPNLPRPQSGPMVRLHAAR